ncbi:helix-turn-helix domain-containing protein [Actinoplanes sp. NBRC 103695]|uniref:ArsR/SmtB family transcription factor n=1 Tax=Actinoplanes sp. NBRC 103695 TaxID=3032202 RepID=UPI0024A24910|nr:helix-turn-helix domain-containing protein [Actinoplanes sp. NBRC 103695]GLZ00958.1 transcriptional regulator [Actinoplanes sp. NBRC 103695]
MLHIEFTPEDVGRVRLAARPDPLWETVFSLYRLRWGGPPLIFGRWRQLAVRASRRPDLEQLMPLVPGGFFPDFLTPSEGTSGLAAGLDALLRTPRCRLRRDVELLAMQGSPLPAWTADLADGDAETLQRLAAAIHSHHEAVVAPVWPEARAHVEADRARRARALLDGGSEGLLRSYLPMMRWNPPVLEVPDFAADRTLRLDGRGLLLLPAFLSWGTTDALHDPELPPVLVYPVEHSLTVSAGQDNTSVAALIGMTRTAVLESVGDGRTTSELARRVGVSAASISQHTAVLREAGLVHTSRIGKAVLHSVTPLGAALLEPRATTDS